MIRCGAVLAVAFALILGASLGCQRSPQDNTVTAPKILRISWTPSEDEPERLTRWTDFARYLEQRLGLPVELVQTGNYSTQIEAFRAKKIEVGSLGPLSYVIGRTKTPIEPLIVRGEPGGVPAAYRALLVVPADSPLRSMEDVRAHAAELDLAWVDPASTSGHLVPRAYLETLGLEPEKDFQHVVFTLSHLVSVLTVKAGKVDIAAVSSSSLERFVRDGRLASSDLRVLWESEPLVTDVTAMRSDLPEDFKQRLRDAYLDFRTDAPEAWAAFAAGMPDPRSIWIAIGDDAFDPIRDLARRVEHLALLDP